MTDGNGGNPYYNLTGFTYWGIVVPRTVPVELALRLAAAVLCEQMGTASVDYQLKQWRNELEAALRPQALPSRPIGPHPMTGFLEAGG